MTFRFKPIKSADFHSTAKGASKVPHSEPDRLLKAPSQRIPSVMAPSISKYSTQDFLFPASSQWSPSTHESYHGPTPPLQQLPLERGGSDERLISKIEQNANSGANLPLSGSERSSTAPFCDMVEKTVRSVLNSSASRTITCHCQWDMRSFLQENFENEKQISSAVILVGTSSLDEVCAMTCSKYIYQTWPKGGPAMLHVLKMLFKSHRNRETCK